MHRYIEETDGMEQGIEQAESVLADVCELERDGELAKLILNMYQMILEKKSLGELRRTADTIKAASLENVV